MNSSFLLLTEHQPELTLLQRSEHRHRRSKQVSGQFPQAAASPPSRPHLDGPGPPPLAVLGARPAGTQLLVVSARLPQCAATARRHLPGRRRSPRRQLQPLAERAANQAARSTPPSSPLIGSSRSGSGRCREARRNEPQPPIERPIRGRERVHAATALAGSGSYHCPGGGRGRRRNLGKARPPPSGQLGAGAGRARSGGGVQPSRPPACGAAATPAEGALESPRRRSC